MTAPSNANTSGLVCYGYRAFNAGIGVCHLVANPGLNDTNPEPLVTAASAQARIAELEAENDVMKVEVIGLRAAIFGSQDYDPSLRHGNFIEMARATEDGRQGALARATAAEARADRLADIVRRCVTALGAHRSGGEYPDFEEWEKDARAALQQETQP